MVAAQAAALASFKDAEQSPQARGGGGSGSGAGW